MSEKPFQGDCKYTQVNNYVIDLLMPVLSPNAFKTLMLIIRHTKGMTDKNGDRIKLAKLSYPDIKEGTGISGNITLSHALRELKVFDLIEVTEGAEYEANRYGINEGHEAKSETDLQQLRKEYDRLRKSETDAVSTLETDLGGKSETDGIIRNKKKDNDKRKERKTDDGANAAPPPPPLELSDVAIPDPVTAKAVTTSPPIAAAPPAKKGKKSDGATVPKEPKPESVDMYQRWVRREYTPPTFCTSSQVELIAKTVTDIPKWERTLSYWAKNAYRPNRVEDLLDAYSKDAGVMDQARRDNPPRRGNHRTPTPSPISPYAAMSEAEKAAYLASCEPMED